MTNYKKEDEMDSIINDSIEHSPKISQEAPVKRGRGRPAKYAPDERKQKQKESIDKWRQEHKEEYKEQMKEYYNDNQSNIIKQKKEYLDRARYALRILDAIYNEKESLNNLSPDLKDKVLNLIEHKKIICL